MDRDEPTASASSALGRHSQKATTTPPPRSTEPQSTPNSHHASSYASALVAKEQRLVDEENHYLLADLGQMKTVDPERFASVILGLSVPNATPSDKKDYWNKLESALGDYLKATTLNPGVEATIYPSAVKLFNAASAASGSEENKKLFFEQDTTPVRGAWVMEKPDIGVVFQQVGMRLAERTKENKDEIGSVFWGLLLYAVELKHQKGKMLKAPYQDSTSNQSQQSKTNQKRAREDEDSTMKQPTASKKAAGSSSRASKKKNPETASSSVSEPNSSTLYKIMQDRKLMEYDRKTPEGLKRQAAGYARDMLSNGILRSHVIVILIDDAMCRFVYYDHSAIVQSEVFDLREKRTLFLKMLEQLHAFDAQQLGIIPGLDAKLLKDPNSLKKGAKMGWSQLDLGEGPPAKLALKGSFYTFPVTSDGRKRTVELGEILSSAYGIRGRGTTVVRVECAHKHGCRKGGQCDWEGLKLVMKISFPSEDRLSEPEIIKRCTEMAIVRREKWVLKHLPKVFCSFTIPFDVNSVQGRLMAEFLDAYEARVIRGSIQEELKPLMKLEAPRQFAQVIYDVFQCHEWVYTYPKVLHRDISQLNIMIREEDGKVYGVLNDFDLATVFETISGHRPTSEHRTGTRPYMAHEQHSISWQGPPRYRHDLESLFYVMLIMVCHYSKPEVKAKELPYLQWFTLGDELLFNLKHTLITTAPWKIPPIDDFFVGFKPFLRAIQRSLRRGVIEHGDYMEELQDSGTSHAVNDEQKHDTLCGHFSYETMRVIFNTFENDALLTRDPKRSN